jgi:mono/diheme cytochrome c family protein
MTKGFITSLTTLLIIIIICCRQNESKVESGQSNDELQITLGQKVFQEHCQSCHRMGRIDESMFAEVFKRLPEPSESYFMKFIRDSKELKRSEDGYARDLDAEFASDYEHRFSDLTDEDIKQIITFIKSKSR